MRCLIVCERLDLDRTDEFKYVQTCYCSDEDLSLRKMFSIDCFGDIEHLKRALETNSKLLQDLHPGKLILIRITVKS